MSLHASSATRLTAARAGAVGPASAAAFAAYAIAIPLVAATGLEGAPADWLEPAAILYILAVYSGTRIAYEVGRGATRSFVLVLHSFAYVFLAIVPIIQMGAGTLLWAVNPSSDVLTEAAIVCLIGVLAFDLGLYMAGASTGPRRPVPGYQTSRTAHALRPYADEGRSVEQRSGHSLSADRSLALLIGLSISSLALLSIRGGLGLVLSSQSEMAAVLCPGMSTGDLAECGVVTALVRVPPLMLLVVALGLRDRASKPVLRVAIVIGIVGLLVTANPISTSRFWFGAALIGVLGVVSARSTRSRVLIWLAFPAALMLLFPVLDFGRYRDWAADFSIQTDVLVQKQDFDSFQQVANGIEFADAYGTRDGAQMASAVLFFVPRSIWDDKAPATGPLVNVSLGVTDNINVSAPLWEEAYVDFGLGGVAAVLFVLGLAIAFVEFAVRSSLAGGGGMLAAVAPFFAAYGMFVLRGSLLPAIGPLTFAVVLVVVVRRLSMRASSREHVGSVGSPLMAPAFRAESAENDIGRGYLRPGRTGVKEGGAGRDVA